MQTALGINSNENGPTARYRFLIEMATNSYYIINMIEEHQVKKEHFYAIFKMF
jgi:hypothetical protein